MSHVQIGRHRVRRRVALGATTVFLGAVCGVAVVFAATNPPADIAVTGSAGGSFGSAVAVGDFNRDGRADLAVGSSGAGGTGQVAIFVAPLPGAAFDAASARAIYSGEASGDSFGQSIAVGDFNRDSRSDLLVGASRNDAGLTGPGTGDTGRAYVFLTSSTGPANTSATAVPQLTGEAPGDRFGTDVATGDINGDGRADVVAGADRNDAAGSNTGRAYAFLTPSTGPVSAAAAAANAVYTGIAANDHFGRSVLAPQLTADTKADIAVSADRDAGHVYVFPTPAGGPVSASAGSAPANYSGEAPNDDFGAALTAARFNRDALDDLVAGAPRNDAAGPDAGRAYVFNTPKAGPVNTATSAASAIFTGQAAGDEFGHSVGVAEISGDHVNDVVVGSSDNDTVGTASGRTYVFRSASTGAVTTVASAAKQKFDAEVAGDMIGDEVAGGDLNGDGIVDVIARSNGNASGLAGAGRVYAFFDTDLDGLTNIVDPDDDNDGRPDGADKCPTSKPPLRDRSPKDKCNDPYSKIVEPYESTIRGRSVVFAGWAEADTIRVAKVAVALQLKRGSRCRNWTGRKLAAAGACSKRRYLKAKGTANWTYTAKRLAKGSWTIYSRATDKKKHVEKRIGANNKRRYKKR